MRYRSILYTLPGLASAGLLACAPVIPIAPGTATSDFVLSETNPGTTFEQFALDGRTYRAPMLSFQIPAGPHRVGVGYTIRISDPCDPEESFCSATVITGGCSGEFVAEVNERYRLLLDTRSGTPKGTIQRRSTGALYIGQSEGIVAPLTCENSDVTSREGSVGIANF